MPLAGPTALSPANGADASALRGSAPFIGALGTNSGCSRMLISGDVLSWSYHNENGSGLTDEEQDRIVRRAYKIWRHSSSLVSDDSSEFKLADAIVGLKRAVNHRLKTLTTSYALDALPFSSERKSLERLQHYGIIRPAILKELFGIRNAIEHADHAPPSVNDCRRYVDFVWYFLKSTDSLLDMKLEDVIFWCDTEARSLRFCPNFNAGWNIEVSGNLLPADILQSWEPGAIDLDESIGRPSYRTPEIFGRWRPTSEQLCTFATTYFELSGYPWDDHE